MRVARRLGLTFTGADVLYVGTNVLVHLRPTAVVARVTRVAHLIRPAADLAGAMALARSAAVKGRVVSPATVVDPGPHVQDSRYVTFWTRYIDGPTTTSASPAEAGSSLRRFHEAARDHVGALRSFDPRPEALKIADLADPQTGAILRAAAGSITVPDLAQQPIHGDAHEENALAGGIWQDLDDVCTGPVEWDLASIQHRRYLFGEREAEIAAALSGYGPHDQHAAESLAPLVVLAVAAWGSMAALIGEEVGPRTHMRLDWLKRKFA